MAIAVASLSAGARPQAHSVEHASRPGWHGQREGSITTYRYFRIICRDANDVGTHCGASLRLFLQMVISQNALDGQCVRGVDHCRP